MTNRTVSKSTIVALILAALAVLVIGCILALPKIHDKTLVKFAEPLLSIPVPERTQELDRLTRIGQQTGNSDHCDYLAALLLKTDLSQKSVEDYYSGKYTGTQRVEFFWTNEPHEPSIGAVNPTGIHTLNDWVNSKAKEVNANLIVYIFDAGMTSALDLRCR